MILKIREFNGHLIWCSGARLAFTVPSPPFLYLVVVTMYFLSIYHKAGHLQNDSSSAILKRTDESFPGHKSAFENCAPPLS